MSDQRVLIYVEDPGAVNFALPLLAELKDAGWNVDLYAFAGAQPYLQGFGVLAKPFVVPKDYEEFLVMSRAQAVMVGTSENSDTYAFYIVAAARRLGVPSLAMVDGPANVTARFRGRSNEPFMHAPDHLLLPDQWTADQYEANGFAVDRLHVTGNPYFEAIFKEGQAVRAQGRDDLRAKLLPADAADRTVAVFLSERSDGLDEQVYVRSPIYTLEGWGGSDRRTNIVLEEFLDAAQAMDVPPYLVLRLHPQDDLEVYAPYMEHIDYVSQGGSAVELLCACDLVVGMTTSLLTEAAMIGLETLSILPHVGERDQNLAVREGVTPFAATRTDLETLLRKFMAGDFAEMRADKELCIQDASKRVVNVLSGSAVVHK